MRKHLTLICCATILSGSILMPEKTEACGEVKAWFCDKFGWFCPSNDTENMSDKTSQMPEEVLVIEEVDVPDNTTAPSETSQNSDDLLVIEEDESPDNMSASLEMPVSSGDVLVVEELQDPVEEGTTAQDDGTASEGDEGERG